MRLKKVKAVAELQNCQLEKIMPASKLLQKCEWKSAPGAFDKARRLHMIPDKN